MTLAKSVTIAYAATLLLSPSVLALDWTKFATPDCVGCYCCDDYCRKPLPWACPVCKFCCDDYCRKPLPCAYPLCKFCCDDYCRKCLPPVCGPPAGHLKCGPPRCCALPHETMPHKTSCQTALPQERPGHEIAFALQRPLRDPHTPDSPPSPDRMHP